MITRHITLPTRKFILKGVGILIVFSFIFLKFADEISEQELHRFDLPIINLIQSFISDKYTKIMKIFTFMGSTKALVAFSLLVVCLMLLNKKWWETLFFIIAVIGSTIFNLLLKFGFHRERPSILPIITETGYSFPSAHAMVSLVFYGMLTYFLVLFLGSKVYKTITIVVFSALILLIGISRIYLGVHYPSDVIAGFAAGGVWLITCLIFLKIILEIRKRKYPNP